MIGQQILKQFDCKHVTAYYKEIERLYREGNKEQATLMYYHASKTQKVDFVMRLVSNSPKDMIRHFLKMI